MIARFLSNVFRKIGERHLLILMLLIAAVSSTAYGVADVLRGLEPEWMLLLGVAAVFFGWHFGRKELTAAWGLILLCLLGVVLLIVVVGRLGSSLWALLRILDRLIYDILNRSEGIRSDLVAWTLTSLDIKAALRDLFAEAAIWIKSLFSAGAYFSVRATRLVWGLTIWLTAGWSGWSLRRWRQPLVSLIPMGSMLAAVMAYTWSSTTALLSFLGAVLLLLGLINNWQRQAWWEQRGYDYPHSAYTEATFMSVGISVFLLALALVVPAISVQNFVRFFNSLTNPVEQDVEAFADSLGLDQRPAGKDYQWLEGTTASNMPRDHLLGSGPELSDQLVMTVEMTAGLVEPQTDGDIGAPHYWRSMTYDIYTGRGWRSTETQVQSYRAGTQIGISDFSYRRAIQQQVRFPERREDFLYTAGDFVSVDRDYQVAWRSKPKDENPRGDFLGAAIDARTYQAQSLLPFLDERALRQQTAPYPDWIQERYLVLPDSLPQQVIDLAQTLTADAESAYDKALALEKYLRTYPYNLDIPAPPDDQDVASYFLFELREGYCDYYATSMAVMARAVGLPARLAVGYARGSYDAANQRYIVTEANAHSWVEIYFPDIGWVSFEPTAGLPAISRPEEMPSSDVPLDDSIEPLPVSLWNRMAQWTKALLWGFAGLAAVLVVSLRVDVWRLRRASPHESISRIYRRLYRFGRRLDVSTRQDITPREFSHTLIANIASHSNEAALAQASEQIHLLTDWYARSAYSPRSLHPADQFKAIRAWLHLRRSLMIVWLRQKVKKIRYNS